MTRKKDMVVASVAVALALMMVFLLFSLTFHVITGTNPYHECAWECHKWNWSRNDTGYYENHSVNDVSFMVYILKTMHMLDNESTEMECDFYGDHIKCQQHNEIFIVEKKNCVEEMCIRRM